MNFALFLERKQLKKEYYEEYGPYKVYLVSDEVVRNLSEEMEDFGGFGTYLQFKRIPRNEIWLSKEANDRDKFFYINNAIAQLKKVESGESSDKAYDFSLKYERKLRENFEDIKIHPEKYDTKAPDFLVKSDYGFLKDGKIRLKIKVVDGELVRDEYKTDYIEGGHGYVYKWVPLNEIWLEDVVENSEKPLILLHEYTELMLMKYKEMGYDKAHSIASKVEFEHRNKDFSKADALNLTKEKVLEMAERFTK